MNEQGVVSVTGEQITSVSSGGTRSRQFDVSSYQPCAPALLGPRLMLRAIPYQTRISSPRRLLLEPLNLTRLQTFSLGKQSSRRSRKSPFSHGSFAASRYSTHRTFAVAPILIRIPQVVRGVVPLRMECAPAFNYARSKHTTAIVPSPSPGSTTKALFQSDGLTLDLRYVPENTMSNVPCPELELNLLDLSEKGHLGLGVQAEMSLQEGQCVTFVLRTPPSANAPPSAEDPVLTKVIIGPIVPMYRIAAHFPPGTRERFVKCTCSSSSPFMRALTWTPIRRPINTGTTGFASQPTPGLGRRPCTAARLRSSS